MKANELRIGNFAQSKRCEILTFIGRTAISQNLYWTNESASIVYDNEILPIQLTEEWLVRFGFIKNLTSWTNWKRPNNTKEVRIGIQGKYLFYNGLLIQHVHQLQNLYFALTGQELEIK